MLAIGVIGVALLVFAAYSEKSHKNRVIHLVGSALVLVYATFLENLVFMALAILILVQGVIEYRKHHKKKRV